MTYNKPLPAKDPESTPFWEGLHRHELLIPQCEECGTYRFPPTSFCPHCRSARTRWQPSKGEGTVFSWIVVRHPVPKEIYADKVPYTVAIVELKEGVRMVGNLQGCDFEDIKAGMPVSISFEDVTGDITLPVFIAKLDTVSQGAADE